MRYVLNAPTRDNIRRRMEQWRRIEEEAFKLEQEENRSRGNSIDDGERIEVTSGTILVNHF